MRAHPKHAGYWFPLLVILVILGTAAPAMASDAAWYDNAWSHRKSVTIDRTKVVTDQKDFPLLINLGGDPDLSYKAQSSGRDILFTLSDGTTKIPVRVESYTSATGALVAWVKVPVLSSMEDTQLFLYFGNPDASGVQDQAGTWTEVYKGNWRRKDIVSWVQTEYNNHNSPSTFYRLGPAESKAKEVVPESPAPAPTPMPVPLPTVDPVTDTGPTRTQPWNDCGWSYRKSITIDHSKVVADQVDFPVLISLGTDPGLAVHAQASGNDILFTLSDEMTKVPHKIESYTPATGALVAWVKVPFVSSSMNTVLYMYYGNPTAPVQQDTSGNWSYRYKGTWNKKTLASWVLTKYNNQMSPSTFYSLGSETYQPQACTPATPTPIPVPDSTPLPIDPSAAPTTADPTITPVPVDPTPTQTEPGPDPTPDREPVPEPAPLPFSCPEGTFKLVTADGVLAGCVVLTDDWVVDENMDIVRMVPVTFMLADSYCLAKATAGYSLAPSSIDDSVSQEFNTLTCTTSGTLELVLPFDDTVDIAFIYVYPSAVVQQVTPEGVSPGMEVTVPSLHNAIYHVFPVEVEDYPMETPTETLTEPPTETPAVTPAEIPTETPVVTPAETPMETPAVAPAETPTETPAG